MKVKITRFAERLDTGRGKMSQESLPSFWPEQLQGRICHRLRWQDLCVGSQGGQEVHFEICCVQGDVLGIQVEMLSKRLYA